MEPIRFNVPIGPESHLELARRMLDEHRALATEPGLRLRREQDGIEIRTGTLNVVQDGAGGQRETTTLLTLTTFTVNASREHCFAQVGDPTRSAEWDPLDRGHELVEAYDDAHLVMRTLTKPPPPWGMRESLLYMVTDRPLSAAQPWVHCVRAVEHPRCPPGRLPRALQHHFGWSVEALGESRARVTAVATVPENLLPKWLLGLASVRGWDGLARKVARLVTGARV